MRQVLWRVPRTSRLIGRLDAAAEARGVSRNTMLTALVSSGLDTVEKVELPDEPTRPRRAPSVFSAERERLHRGTCRCGPQPTPPVAGRLSLRWPMYLADKAEWDRRHAEHP